MPKSTGIADKQLARWVSRLSPYHHHPTMQVYQRQLLKWDYSCGAVDGAGEDAHRYYTSDELAQACSLRPALGLGIA